jgi:hypothetical protein
MLFLGRAAFEIVDPSPVQSIAERFAITTGPGSYIRSIYCVASGGNAALFASAIS